MQGTATDTKPWHKLFSVLKTQKRPVTAPQGRGGGETRGPVCRDVAKALTGWGVWGEAQTPLGWETAVTPTRGDRLPGPRGTGAPAWRSLHLQAPGPIAQASPQEGLLCVHQGSGGPRSGHLRGDRTASRGPGAPTQSRAPCTHTASGSVPVLVGRWITRSLHSVDVIPS